MKLMPKENGDDRRLHYRQTWARHIPSEEVVMLKDFGENMISCMTTRGNNIAASIDEIDVEYPIIGQTVFRNGMGGYVYRKPARISKMGFYDPAIEWPKEPTKYLSTMEMVESVFNNKYYSVEDALKALKKQFYAPINSKFALAVVRECEHPVLKYKDDTVGIVKNGIIHIPRSSIFLKESIESFSGVNVL